jgi:hypothetical protein
MNDFTCTNEAGCVYRWIYSVVLIRYAENYFPILM